MAQTQKINDFIINIGRSARRGTDKEIVEASQRLVNQADIGKLRVGFSRNGELLGSVVPGSVVGRKTAISVVSDRKLKKYGLHEVGSSLRISSRMVWRGTTKRNKNAKKTGY